jgi:tetrahydromethanopterin S-methyltransferase subunit B
MFFLIKKREFTISPEPLKMEVEPAVVNPQITDAVTQQETPIKKKVKKSKPVTEEKVSEAKPKATVGEIKSGAKKTGKK